MLKFTNILLTLYKHLVSQHFLAYLTTHSRIVTVKKAYTIKRRAVERLYIYRSQLNNVFEAFVTAFYYTTIDVESVVYSAPIRHYTVTV